MIRLEQYKSRLAGETELVIKGAAELDAAQADHRKDTAYIILLGESAAGDTTAGHNEPVRMVRQMTTLRLGVILAIRNQRDRRGDGALTELEAARQSVLRALLGWQPDDAAGATMFVRGQVAEFAEKTVWWQDEFAVDHLITSAATA